MSDWLNSWYTIYQDTHTKWEKMTEAEQKKRLSILEKMADQVMYEWAELDELMNELRIKKNELLLCTPYESPGTTYYQLNMFEQAAKVLTLEKATGEKEELRLLYLGYSYLFSNAWDLARETFLYINQMSRHAYFKHFSYVGLGCVYMKLGRVDEAIHTFEYAKELTTTDDVVYNLGICYFSIEIFHIARKHFQEYVNRVPDDGEALFLLGCCEWLEGERDDALTSWLMSTHLLDTPSALLSLAYVCEWHGYHQMAIHCYKRLEQKKFEPLKVLHGLAWNYALIEEYEKAYEIFKEALEIEPFNENIHQSLVWLHDFWPMAKGQKLLSETISTNN